MSEDCNNKRHAFKTAVNALARVDGIVVLILALAYCYILYRMEETEDSNFNAAFVGFALFAQSAVKDFFGLVKETLTAQRDDSPPAAPVPAPSGLPAPGAASANGGSGADKQPKGE